MSLLNYLLILVTVCGTVIGQLILKYGQTSLAYPKTWHPKNILLASLHNLLNIYFILALFFALIAALAWSLVIQKMNLSLAYPFMALSYVLIIVLSCLIFKESLAVYQIIGALLIIIGIALIGLK